MGDESMVERVKRAIEEERKRWVMRSNDDSEEACRYDDSGLAGHFSEIHKVGRGRSAEARFEELRAVACARAAIAAMREPTEAMIEAGFGERSPSVFLRSTAVESPASAREIWRAMIDAAPKHGESA